MSTANGNGLVLVTGATGFIAKHCIIQLLNQGWHVRGTLRSLSRADGLMKTLHPHCNTRDLSLVEAELGSDRGWEEAVRGCRYVLHLASPVPITAPKRPEEVIAPARDGTLRVLRAAAHAEVQRVVMTSSIAAVLYGHTRDGSRVYDEHDWSNLTNEVGAYEQSKTLAERAAWDYVAALSDANQRMELVTINPGAILGPTLDEDFSVSGEIVRKLMLRELPGCPDLGWALVDVRDVAGAHLTAMTHPRAAGQRFIVATKHVAMREIAQVLSERFAPMGFKVPTGRLPSWILKLVALWDKTVAMAVKELGKRQDVSSEKAHHLLGWQSRPVEQMVVDMAESMIRCGVIAPPKGARLPVTARNP